MQHGLGSGLDGGDIVNSTHFSVETSLLKAYNIPSKENFQPFEHYACLNFDTRRVADV
jgi:hypothetical protein